ncbi:MAG: hypothetical protein KF788_08685 [Piscinibacter sp.]|nr:hypothetical protein [Piscinibacter sp.]
MRTAQIHTHGRFAMLPQRQEVLWPDGTAVALHPVRENGHDSMFHRAVVTRNGLRIVFDLRKVCPPLDADLRACPARDVPGVVFYTLRHHLPSANHLEQAAKLHSLAVWVPMQEEAGA